MVFHFSDRPQNAGNNTKSYFTNSNIHCSTPSAMEYGFVLLLNMEMPMDWSTEHPEVMNPAPSEVNVLQINTLPIQSYSAEKSNRWGQSTG